MAFDAHKNLAISTVATAPSPATSGTALSVTAGDGGRFPAPPFNATVWPASQPPTPANAELVRVTAVTGDGLTITRATEGSTARSIVVGDLIAATITAKVITDIEAGTNFPLITTAGAGSFGGGVVLTHPTAAIIRANTIDGADTVQLQIASGGQAGDARGACLNLFGNEQSGGRPGAIDLITGNTATGKITLYTGATQVRGVIHPSGGFSWGGTVDPSAGQFSVGAQGFGVGNTFTVLAGGGLYLGGAGTAANQLAYFYNANGQVGNISTNGTVTAYATTSDARLKTDRGLLTDPDVLRHTKIHHFTWNTDGTVGRGVFAQEAITVAPFAVSVGTDARDEHGNLTQPWGVDYSKFVPDLIAGWQYHDQTLEGMANRIAFLEGAITAMRTRENRPTIINRIMTALRAVVTTRRPKQVAPCV